MFQRFVHVLATDPFSIPIHVWTGIFAFGLKLRRNVKIQGKLRLNGQPIVDIRKGSHLYIGAGVVLNSRNKGYHLNMHSPVKLFADRPGACIRIGNHTRIHGSCIHAFQSVEIGNNCLIAANCQIFDGNGHDLSFPDVGNRIHTEGTGNPVKIGDNVWIGADSMIFPGVTIGAGSVIAARSVVVDDIPPKVLAGGHPATVWKQYAPVDAATSTSFNHES